MSVAACAALVVMGYFAAGGPSVAASAEDRIGAWRIKIEEDRFDRDKTLVTAFVEKGVVGFGMRCLTGGLSLMLIDLRPRSFVEGDFIAVKMRADSGPVVDLKGVALSRNAVELLAEREVIEGLRNVREIALRVSTSGVQYDLVFPARGSASAVANVLKACPSQ